MEALNIKSKNKKDLALIKELVKKMGLESKSLTAEEMEDIGLSILMKEVDRTQYSEREEVMRILDSE